MFYISLTTVLTTAFSYKHFFKKCEQVNDLLCLMAEFKVERLRSIRESEREIDWWSCTLSTPKEVQQETVKPYPSCYQADGANRMDEVEWKQVPDRRGKRSASQPPSSLPRVPLKNRYEVLEPEGQVDNSQEEDLSVAPCLPDGLQLQS
ncbi:hypothetical protein WISP_102327 [Willisornis vidua]|uniref:Uncharacterized protein n=1 Tax=Willisornis vidua TaxID=1566151 RepID=A0ABQ9D437_9PASS|nr:hypothetical protein WISP_102327 [Willisornis vidua]